MEPPSLVFLQLGEQAPLGGGRLTSLEAGHHTPGEGDLQARTQAAAIIQVFQGGK